MSSSGEHVYSGSLDGTINAWKVPDSNIDPYDSYGMEAARLEIKICIICFVD